MRENFDRKRDNGLKSDSLRVFLTNLKNCPDLVPNLASKFVLFRIHRLARCN